MYWLYSEHFIPQNPPLPTAKGGKMSDHNVSSQEIAGLLRSFPRLFSHCLQVSGINASMSRKREQRVLFMVVIMVMCYLICWLPYGIMALLATFGPPGLVTPEASIIPSVLAKTSTVINPVIYVFMNKQVRGGRAEAGVSTFFYFAVKKWQPEVFLPTEANDYFKVD